MNEAQSKAHEVVARIYRHVDLLVYEAREKRGERMLTTVKISIGVAFAALILTLALGTDTTAGSTVFLAGAAVAFVQMYRFQIRTAPEAGINHFRTAIEAVGGMGQLPVASLQEAAGWRPATINALTVEYLDACGLSETEREVFAALRNDSFEDFTVQDLADSVKAMLR